MKTIIVYLLLFAVVLTYLLAAIATGSLPIFPENFHLVLSCVFIGGLGGCVYCLRGVYLSASVNKNWDDGWRPWYYIRPFVSLICGGTSFLFLKAGLLILEANERADSSEFGFLALAFIAGLNVDKFISKIEDVAQAAWGIEKSRASKLSDKPNP